MKVKFVTWKWSNKDSSKSLYLCVSHKSKQKYISTEVKVLPRFYDKDKNRVLRGDPRYMEKNKILITYENKVNNILSEYIINDKNITIDLFVKDFKNDLYGNTDFCKYVLNKINTRFKNKDLASETKRTFTSQISKLEQFTPELTFDDINESFIEDYKSYMINELGNKLNTYNKSIGMIKTFCNWAVKDEIISKNPLTGISLSFEPGKRDFLETKEVEKLEGLYDSGTLPKSLQNVLRYFLFTCYVGLRYRDMKQLTFEHFEKISIDNKAVYIIRKKQSKTSRYVEIPIIPKALKYVAMDDKISEFQNAFKVLTNQPTNRHLKSIAEKAGLTQNLTFHVARYTFGSIAIEHGISIEHVSKLLGHSSIAVTYRIYTKNSTELKYKELLKLEK